MPKLVTRPNHFAGFNPLAPPTNTMAAYYNQHGQPTMAGYYRTETLGAPGAQSLAVGSYHDPYAVAPLTMPPPGDNGMNGPLPTQHRASSGAWSFNDDQTLLQARAKGDNWAKIQSDWFPSKTANACRKRHERLMERKGADDWDSREWENVADQYMKMRKEIWDPLAKKLGLKWNLVEQKVSSARHPLFPASQ